MRADSLVFQIRHNAKPQNDIDHAMATVRNQTERQKMKRTVIFGQAVFAILRKSKREATPHTKPTQVASHLLLPQRTKSYLHSMTEFFSGQFLQSVKNQINNSGQKEFQIVRCVQLGIMQTKIKFGH